MRRVMRIELLEYTSVYSSVCHQKSLWGKVVAQSHWPLDVENDPRGGQDNKSEIKNLLISGKIREDRLNFEGQTPKGGSV